jgi:ATP/maltotriose-dependent transcriptional regulator MalT
MKRQTLIHVLIYGVTGGALIVLLRLIEFRFVVIEHSIEIYGALIAALFASFGIWLGLKLTRKEVVLKEVEVIKEVAIPTAEPFSVNEEQQRQLGITKRELEILALIAEGLSNREIAGKLFVSENTVKTHLSRLFDKLSAKRRTQAVQIGKEIGLIP